MRNTDPTLFEVLGSTLGAGAVLAVTVASFAFTTWALIALGVVSCP